MHPWNDGTNDGSTMDISLLGRYRNLSIFESEKLKTCWKWCKMESGFCCCAPIFLKRRTFISRLGMRIILSVCKVAVIHLYYVWIKDIIILWPPWWGLTYFLELGKGIMVYALSYAYRHERADHSGPPQGSHSGPLAVQIILFHLFCYHFLSRFCCYIPPFLLFHFADIIS